MENKELIIIIKADGKFEVDFEDKSGRINEEKILFQENLYTDFKSEKYKTLYFLGLNSRSEHLSISTEYLINISKLFISKLSKNSIVELIRDNVKIEITEIEVENLIDDAPYMLGLNNLNHKWFKQIFVELNKIFSEEIKNYDGTVKEYLQENNSDIHLVGRVYFHLVESKDEEFPFAFLATYSSVTEGTKKEKHIPLVNALTEYKDDDGKMLKLLATVNKVKENSFFISELVKSGEIFHPLKLSSDEAYIFLKEIEIYEQSGIRCRIPKWYDSKSSGLKMTLDIGDENRSRVDFKAIVNFNAKLHLNGDEITVEEIKKLLSETEGLAFIKGKWIEVNHKKLEETLRNYEMAQKYAEENEMSVVEAMRFQLDAKKILDFKDEVIDVEVTNGQWLNSIVSKLKNPNEIEQINVGDNLNANLRHYQEDGLNWLYFMKELGLGACLADDMGLGKTVQVIALLNHVKDEKSLVVVPVSLIGNWMSEIEKFAPDLKYYVIHKSENKKNEIEINKFDEDYDLYITSYGMLDKYEWIKESKWDNLILDEAQAIKNPGTKRTKTVKNIRAKYKLAMTGTPIENKLSDLWSLFDFLNEGLLGSKKEFKDLMDEIYKNHGDYGRLKHIVNPFILRRLKTDKKIISDLPEKIEMKVYSTLSKKQTMLYEKLVKSIVTGMSSETDGISRKGLILSSIMKFKQICNHPDQYLGQSGYIEKESGKFKRLGEIAEEIYEKRERVIVFTQFKEMTEPLKIFLETIFNHKGYVLHGGTAPRKRKEIVDTFQGEEYVPFIVLSIKAGGVGLNLTKANHVIHFDRWWNPAVENQATDRAFRIGQKKNVVVHKFVTKGTIEEKIDLMIEEKSKLSDDVISGDQTKSITEMDNNEILELFKLTV